MGGEQTGYDYYRGSEDQLGCFDVVPDDDCDHGDVHDADKDEGEEEEEGLLLFPGVRVHTSVVGVEVADLGF